MKSLTTAVSNFNLLENLADNTTIIHKLNPLTKTITTFLYVVIVVSFPRHSISCLMPYFFYTAVMLSLAEIPFKPILTRLAVAFPFCFFAGISNVFFERNIAFYITPQLSVSFGVLSLFSILIKMFLTVSAVLILIATTGLPVLARQLIRLKVPSSFVLLLSMTYRYISVLMEECINIYTAYQLRSGKTKGIQIKDMGVFLGQILLRSMDRAERIYHAMKCRGFSAEYSYIPTKKIPWTEIVYIILLTIVLLFWRII